ncbi:hypothetical protein K491DRAFT_754919 [Lophiostoma macrostomum CBS 122681]|uniref:Uncharacterized protein n=1 Tax=Lophiostoma macrostomum CBS 122681 TaxID=1314788 RepID=A0A6A6TMB7_9PLEO|nr:hypothetical protein K491DRAFT_754919 [Lophiostoma macrostomum CBS 122681]
MLYSLCALILETSIHRHYMKKMMMMMMRASNWEKATPSRVGMKTLVANSVKRKSGTVRNDSDEDSPDTDDSLSEDDDIVRPSGRASRKEPEEVDDPAGYEWKLREIEKLRPSITQTQYAFGLCRQSATKVLRADQQQYGKMQAIRKLRDRRSVESLLMLHRLEIASNHHFTFVDAFSCSRRGIELTPYVKPAGKRPDFSALCAAALLLIRSVDGFPHDVPSVTGLCHLVEEKYGVKTLILFQYGKIFDAIRPYRMVAVRGLGDVADIDARTLLDYLQGTTHDKQAEALERIWKRLVPAKGGIDKDDIDGGHGIQDRNTHPPAGQLGAKETTSKSRYGQNKKRAMAKQQMNPQGTKRGKR